MIAPQSTPLRPQSTVLHRHAAPASRFLLVVNKGPGAVRIAREGKAWDLMEILFTAEDIEAVQRNPAASDADHVVFETDRRMRKFSTFRRVLERYPQFDAYQAIFLCDDDLLPVGCSVADIFEQFMLTGFRIGQPALTRDSYWSHEIVLQDPRFRWRITNFVEVMCPLMTLAALRDYMPVFGETISNFGLDNYWSAREWELHGGLVILDSTPVRHVRPVRGGLAYRGVQADAERLAFFNKHRLRNYRHLTLGGEPSVPGASVGGLPISYRSQIRDRLKFGLKRTVRRALSSLLPNFYA